MVHDADGFAIYWVLDDAAIECTACDPDAGPPEVWPAWTDLDRFTCIDPDDQVEPTDADVEWLNVTRFPLPISGGSPEPENEWEPSPEDWRDYHEHCLEVERLDALRRRADYEYELRMRYGD
jgi:hypothetical protein